MVALGDEEIVGKDEAVKMGLAVGGGAEHAGGELLVTEGKEIGFAERIGRVVRA